MDLRLRDCLGPILYGLAMWWWAWTGWLPGNWQYEPPDDVPTPAGMTLDVKTA